MGMNFIGWVEQVCGCVRFWPDRKAIRKELWAHYEDHCRDLERLQFEPAQARQRALEAMGDAREVGVALDRVHKPWLGWLWEISRVILAGLVLLGIVTLLRTADVPQLADRLRGEREEIPETAAQADLAHATLCAVPGKVTERDDGYYTAEVELWLRLREPLWEEYGVVTYYFTYRDPWGEIPLYAMDDRTRTAPAVRYWKYGDSTFGWKQCHQTVELVLEEPPRWVEISYPLSGGDWSLRIEWEGME